MPIAAKFSEDFYERFGHQATGELVDYLNSIDSGYRSDLERLNEANWARFEDHLERRVTELEAKLNARIDRLEAKMEQRFAEMKSEMLKWMFLFWLGTIGIVLGVKL
jgi:hypothetical protein